MRHLDLRPTRTPREHLDPGPVLVPGREIHGGESGNGAQDFVHEADALEEPGPVDGGYPSHAGDDVPDGDVGRGLRLVLLGHHLVGRGALRSQMLVEPGQDRHDGEILAAKPLDELYGERAGQGGVAQASQDAVGTLDRPAAEAHQAIRRLIGPGPLLAGVDDQLRQASKVLHERHAKVDGDRPEFADGQRLDTLVGKDESPDCLHLEPAVGMGDVGPCQPVDTGIPREMARLDLRKQAVVAAWEVVPDATQLFVHDVEVVEDPLGGGCDLLLRHDRCGDVPVAGQKQVRVLADPGEEIPPFPALPGGAMGRGQALGMLLEALDAEDLGADRFFHRRRHVEGDGLHVELPSRVGERVLPFPDPGRFGDSGLDRRQEMSRTSSGLLARTVGRWRVEAPRSLALVPAYSLLQLRDVLRIPTPSGFAFTTSPRLRRTPCSGELSQRKSCVISELEKPPGLALRSAPCRSAAWRGARPVSEFPQSLHSGRLEFCMNESCASLSPIRSGSNGRTGMTIPPGGLEMRRRTGYGAVPVILVLALGMILQDTTSAGAEGASAQPTAGPGRVSPEQVPGGP